jgi:hypothetical protein
MDAQIDLITGRIVLDAALALDRGISTGELRAAGVSPLRVAEMTTGWAYWAIGPYSVFGVPCLLSLQFFRDRLIRIACAPGSTQVQGRLEAKKIHDQLLRSKLGSPSLVNERDVTYSFPWGTIVSSSDSKDDQAEILMEWSETDT